MLENENYQWRFFSCENRFCSQNETSISLFGPLFSETAILNQVITNLGPFIFEPLHMEKFKLFEILTQQSPNLPNETDKVVVTG